jgi:cellulose biosynthesis protein BcsQ
LFESITDIQKIYRYTIPLVSIVPNHYNGSYSVSRQILEGLRDHYGNYLTKTVIRQDVNFDKSNALRQSIFSLSATSKGSRDLEALSLELLETIKRGTFAQDVKEES